MTERPKKKCCFIWLQQLAKSLIRELVWHDLWAVSITCELALRQEFTIMSKYVKDQILTMKTEPEKPETRLTICNHANIRESSELLQFIPRGDTNVSRALEEKSGSPKLLRFILRTVLMSSPNVMALSPVSKMSSSWWHYWKSWGVTKINRIHPLRTMNTCTKVHSVV